MSPVIIVGLAVVAAVVVLLLPRILRKKPSPFLGPDLSELQYTEVLFENGELHLAGLLFLPQGSGPFPVVVVIHGSGTSRRNSIWYLTVAKYLQEHGVAVLLPDKRGSEKSEGDWRKATFYDLAGDALGAIRFIKAQTLFEYSKIGAMGFSQGGWIAPIVAGEDRDVAFVVSMSGAGVTTDEQLVYEEIYNIAEFTYLFLARLLAPIAAKQVQKTEFWSKIGGFDPIPCWRNVQAPVLMAFGEGDRNVPVEESVRRIRDLDKPNIAIKVYPQAGHGIIDRNTHRVREDYLRDLVEFIGAG